MSIDLQCFSIIHQRACILEDQGIQHKADLNEWVTWFFNAFAKLDKEERDKMIKQIREGDEEVMCSSFERILNSEKAEAIIELLEEIGTPSETLREYVMRQTNLEVLRKWLKAAAGAKAIEDFEQAIGLV